MTKPFVVHIPPNTIKHMGEMYAVLSVDATGEGICACKSAIGWMAMVTADERVLNTIILPQAQRLASETGVELRLVKFTTREEIEVIQP